MGEEVLQAVGADGVLTLLLDEVVMYRQKLRSDGAVKHVIERGLENLVLGLAGDVADVCAHLGLGQAKVHVVHAGMVAVIGAPAVDKLAEILGADVKAVDLIGDVHEHLRALTRLRVLKGNGVIVMRVADIVKVLVDGLADVDNANLRADLLGDDDGVGLGAGRGAEAGQSAGDDVRARKPHFLHGHGADHDGKSGVHTAGDADYAVVKPCVLHALYKAGDLDIKHALAVGRQILCLFGQVRVLLVGAGEGGVLKLAAPRADVVRIIAHVEAALRAAEVYHVLNVYLADGKAVFLLVGGEDDTVFGDHAQTGIDILGSALALAGRGHDDAAAQLLRLIAQVQLRLIGGGDGLGEGGHLRDKGSARERMAQSG